jgi:hypothetical protein
MWSGDAADDKPWTRQETKKKAVKNRDVAQSAPLGKRIGRLR